MAVRAVDVSDDALLEDLDQYRRELTGHCYRMLGSAFEAEDAVQETMVRAWRSIDSFEGRAALRSWLYRIATNVCLDMLRSCQRRARPMDLGPSSTAATPVDAGLAEHMWVTPIADSAVVPDHGDPAVITAAKEEIRLAFVSALQHLPPRQRAVLVLRDVLRWQASEVAALLQTSVASVNSALQRAHATMAAHGQDAARPQEVDADQEALLTSYVDAFERYDISLLVTLLHEDATMSMPPYALWLQGSHEIGEWFLGQGRGCRGGRLVPASGNGVAAFGSYRIDPAGGYVPWSVQILDIRNGRIAGLHSFLGSDLFPSFGLPAHLD